MLQTVKEILICGVLIAVIAIGFRIFVLIDYLDTRLPMAVNARLDVVQTELDSRIDTVIQDADGQITEARKDIIGQVAGIRMDLTGTILPTVVNTLDARLNSIQADANSQLTVLNSTVKAQATQLNATITDAAKPIVASASQVNAALPDFLDCQVTDDGVGNKNCLYIRYSDLTSELDRTLGAITQAAPDMATHADSIAASADQISKDVTREADQLTKPESFWSEVKTWLLFGARMGATF